MVTFTSKVGQIPLSAFVAVFFWAPISAYSSPLYFLINFGAFQSIHNFLSSNQSIGKELSLLRLNSDQCILLSKICTSFAQPEDLARARPDDFSSQDQFVIRGCLHILDLSNAGKTDFCDLDLGIWKNFAQEVVERWGHKNGFRFGTEMAVTFTTPLQAPQPNTHPTSALVTHLKEAIVKKNPFTFAYFEEKLPFTEISAADYMDLLQIANHSSNPPCFFNRILSNMNVKFKRFNIDQLLYENGALTAKGIQYAFSTLAPRNLKKTIQPKILRTTQDLKLEVKAAVLDQITQDFFVDQNHSGHWSSVHASHKDGQCIVQILDASHHAQALLLRSELRGMISSGDLPTHCQVLWESKDFPRQADDTNCGIFAVNDLITLYKLQEKNDPISEMEPLSHQCPLPQNGYAVVLSPEFMTLAQRLKILKDYLRRQQKNPHGRDDPSVGLSREYWVTLPPKSYNHKVYLDELLALNPTDPSLQAFVRSLDQPFPLIEGNYARLYYACSSPDNQLYWPEESEPKTINVGAKTIQQKIILGYLNDLIFDQGAGK